MRSLTLHTSALNDEEYALYTSSLTDLALCDEDPPGQARDDGFYERIVISVRETRAWLRGRYSDTLPLGTIDVILRLFSPNLAQADTISGGQFFAVSRLILHVLNGRGVDRSLAFLQAHPSPSSNAGPSSSHRLVPDAPQLPRRSADAPSVSEPQTNPFSYEHGQQPPLHPSQRSDSDNAKPIPLSPNNPFVARSKPISSRSEDGPRRPPLPPRKPSISSMNSPIPPPIPPPRPAASISSPTPTRLQPPTSTLLRTSPTQSHPPPIPPPFKAKPAMHVTSPLIQQSLMASKTAKTMKRAEEQLEKERVLQVLRSSAVSSPFSNVRNGRETSPAKHVPPSVSDSSSSWSGSDDRPPALPRRRRPQRSSPPMSATSLEQIALAAPPSRSTPHTPTFTPSPFDSPTRPTVDLPPPTHPDRKAPPPPPPDSSFRRNLESFEAIYGTSPFASPAPTVSSRTSPPSPAKPYYSLSVDAGTPTEPTAVPQFPASSAQQGQSRVQRSRSLHVPSTSAAGGTKGPPPVPPPKPPSYIRKRPDSIQVLPSTNGETSFGPSTVTTSTFHEAKHALFSQPPPSAPLMNSGHRRSSHSSSFGGSTSAFLGVPASATSTSGETIQRKLAELQLSAMPVFEKARYKAEAGLSPRRGFIPNGSSSSSAVSGRRSSSRGQGGEDREGLMSGYEYAQEDYEDDVDGVGQDDTGDGSLRSRGRDRDELKWPAGEGWNRML